MKVLLDTCTILWAVSDPSCLSERVKKTLIKNDTEVLVSPMSCAEVACAVDRKKIQLDRHWKLWFRHFIKQNEWAILPVNLPIVEEAYSLPEPFHKDPVDRILVATCRLYKLTLLTADKKILNYPHVEAKW